MRTSRGATKLVIIGAGGFGREVLDVVEACNDDLAMVGQSLEAVGFLDDGDPDPKLLEPYGVGHIGPVSALESMPVDVGYVIGIGSPKARADLDARFASSRDCPVLVHPSATVGRRAVEFGPGSIVCAQAALTNHIRLGRHVHVNLGSTIGHDATLADYVTLSPLVAISGGVKVEAGAFFGTGATVNPGLTVGAGAVIGSGASVIRDAPADAVSVGVPAKPR